MTAQPTPRGWRRLPLPDLEEAILQRQREAARRHLLLPEWRELDRMRKRSVALRKEAAAS